MDDVGVCGVEHHEIGVAGAFVLNQGRGWGAPRRCHRSRWRSRWCRGGCGRRSPSKGIAAVVAHAGNAHAAVALVPHAELTGILVSPYGTVEGKAALPGVERGHYWVAGVLGGLVQSGCQGVGLVDYAVVDEKLRGSADVDCHACGPPLGEQCATRGLWGKGRGRTAYVSMRPPTRVRVAWKVFGVNDLLMKLKSRKDRKGSKPRCHWLTHGTREQVANRLTAFVEPWGTVSMDDRWMPEGFCRIEEARLDRAPILPQQDRYRLRDWWLTFSRGANTPNWDIVSTCAVNGAKGILLVEAKAHNEELNKEENGKSLARTPSDNSIRNHERIGEAIEEANIGLGEQTGFRWALSRDHHYQMSNRFAWSWKLTELGYSVILVYLGFLNAEEMRKGKEQYPLANHAEWESLVKSHSGRLFPAEIWDRQWSVNGRIFVPRIRSCEMRYDAPIEE